VSEFDDLGNLWTRPRYVGVGAVAICVIAAFLVLLFVNKGKLSEAVVVTTGTLCLLVVGLMDLLAALIRSTRGVEAALEKMRIQRPQ
jgi:UDP-N-acetylmuramyl pentapeptide phosphotransferase/UDP-N-acetylglucosamine-1-phosphate transferase